MFNARIQAEYSNLFYGPPPKLEELFKKGVDIAHLVALSMISFTDATPQERSWCKRNLALSLKGRNSIDELVISKRPSNLILWSFISGETIKSNEYDHSTHYKHLGEIITALSVINQQEREHQDDNGYLIKNLLHKYQDNPLYQFYRSAEIFLRTSTLDKYVMDFESTNGISVRDFVFICHAINIKYLTELSKPISEREWILDTAAFSNHTNFSTEKVSSTLKLISFTQHDAKKHAASDKFADHDFNLFSNRPFLAIDGGKYIPIDIRLTQNLVFNNLFYRIKSSATNKKSFMRDFGLAFESYASSLVRYACENSKSYKYTYIPEFDYGCPTKKSSDAYISFYDKTIKTKIILVFEFKSAKVLDSAKRLSENDDAIERSIGKVTIAPTEQQIKRTSEIVDGCFHEELTKENVYYFISISMDDFPVLIGDWNVKINYSHLSNLKSGGIYSFCIEELELFVKMISNNLERPAPYLLERYRTEHSDLSFKTYLSRLEKKVNFQNKPFEQKIIDSQKIIIDHLNNKK